MRLTQRLLLGSLVVGSVLVIFIIAIATGRLEDRLLEPAVRQLERDARIVAGAWVPGAVADSLADWWGAALGRRVTLIGIDGRVLGDSEYEEAALARLDRFTDRPEVIAAMRGAPASDVRTLPDAADEILFVAVRAPGGIVRIGQPTDDLQEITRGARTDILIGGLVALVIAMLLSALFARAISRPIVELRDVAQAFAAGDVSRRPTLAAPGEIGDLATALYRMAGQLGSRLEALEREEALLHALIESLNEGIIAVDARRQLVQLNESGRRLLGIRGGDQLTVDHLPRDRLLRDALEAALEGSPTTVEVRLDDRVLLLTARPLADGGAVLALYDLTPVRRLETVRRDFVANVSHELKTPITVISGFAETLAEEDPPEPHRRQFVETIRANARRMQRIVDDLLDLSRIESGGWIPAPAWLDLRAMAEDAGASLRQIADSRGIRVATAIDDAAAPVWADQTALRQVLDNLVENAVRYTGEGGEVTILAQASPDGVWLAVRDTGVGIPAEHLPRIFERFYRVDPGRSRDAGGTGLGLSIVRHLVEAHGGRVRAESAPGRGTTIWCLFPGEDQWQEERVLRVT
ncbi:MAG TPA: ATP-binding protein [Gemmatimonadaceae bacterium]|nr:ATP-binding protein [Gemmatimonadaceae bacterium]